MEKALRKISKQDKPLFAEIVKKIQFFENGEHEKLDIVPIKRKNGKHKICEIRIMSPGSYRIFYVAIDEKSKTAIFVDGQRKKVDAFKNSYFDTLDNAIDDYLSS